MSVFIANEIRRNDKNINRAIEVFSATDWQHDSIQFQQFVLILIVSSLTFLLLISIVCMCDRLFTDAII